MAPQSPSKQARIQFHYIKSNYSRVIHVDGAIGGVTPQGLIHCALYTERLATPEVTEQPVLEGHLGEGETIKGRTGFVREIDVDLMLSLQKTVELRDWLTRQIKTLEELQRQTAQPPGRIS